MDPLAALGLFKDRTFRVVSQLVDRVKELERENDVMSEDNERLQNELAEHKLLVESLLNKQRTTTAALVKLYKERPSPAAAKQLRCVGSGGECLTLSRPQPLFIPSTHYGGAPIQHESLHVSPHETTQSPHSSLVAVSVATRSRKYSAVGTQETKLRVCLSNAQRRRQFHAFLKAEYVGRDR